jgi:N,N-dimethylformamidase
MTRHQVDHADAPVAGYTDRFSVRPGERLRVMASSSHPDCELRVLRISHDGSAPVRTVVGVPHRVRVEHESIDHGSYGLVPTPPALGRAVTFAVWVWPTAWPSQEAGLLVQGCVSDQEPGFGPGAQLGLRADGRVTFLARTSGGVIRCVSSIPLRLRRWYLIAGSYDPDHGARLTVWPSAPLPDEPVPSVTTQAPGGSLVSGPVPLLLAARPGPDARPGPVPAERADGMSADGCLVPAAREVEEWTRCETVGHLDGKLDAPCVFDRLLSLAELTRLATSRATPADLGPRAYWDLSRDIGGERMVDVAGGHHGELRHLPLRAVTGHDWAGDVLDWRFAERGYGAVHFHSDDVGDAGWPVVAEIEVPLDLPSGCYAVELTSPEGVDRVPFFVRAAACDRKAPLVLLVPTLSYLAYALDHLRQPHLPEQGHERAAHFARANRLHSLYDHHSDATGVATVSSLRPLFGMRDDHIFRYTNSVHQYSADVQLVGWLERQGLEFDVLTDHDLHADGVSALAGYRAVLTGSHPEYWTGAMLDGVEEFVHGGGRLGYLGGNGAYWVTAIAPGRPHVVELRRGYCGVRTWESQPGESYLACTGEPGGLWQERARSAHRLFGVGVTAAGMSPGAGYQLLADRTDPVTARIFDGLDAESDLGGFGSVLAGAASFETDAVDPLLGTPPNAVVLGRAMLGDAYVLAHPGPIFGVPNGDPVDPRRADVVYLETTGGGAVFAAGSIGWCAALSHDKDDNAVSRLTANVLRWFCED